MHSPETNKLTELQPIRWRADTIRWMAEDHAPLNQNSHNSSDTEKRAEGLPDPIAGTTDEISVIVHKKGELFGKDHVKKEGPVRIYSPKESVTSFESRKGYLPSWRKLGDIERDNELRRLGLRAPRRHQPRGSERLYNHELRESLGVEHVHAPLNDAERAELDKLSEVITRALRDAAHETKDNLREKDPGTDKIDKNNKLVNDVWVPLRDGVVDALLERYSKTYGIPKTVLRQKMRQREEELEREEDEAEELQESNVFPIRPNQK